MSLKKACKKAISKLKKFKTLPFYKRKAKFPYLNPVHNIFSKKLLPFTDKAVDKSIGPEKYGQVDYVVYDNYNHVREVEKVLRHCEVDRKWKRKVEKISEIIGEIEGICKKSGVLELLSVELPCLAISPKSQKYMIKYYGSISHMDEDVTTEIINEIIDRTGKKAVLKSQVLSNSIVFVKLSLKITLLPWTSYKIIHAQYMKSLIISEPMQKVVKLVKYWSLGIGFTSKKLAEIIGTKGDDQYLSIDWGFRKCLENIAEGMLINGHYIIFLDYQKKIIQRLDVARVQKAAQDALILLSQGQFYEIFETAEDKA